MTLAVAATVTVLASTATQSAARAPAPVREWINDRAVVRGDGEVVADASRLRSPGPGRFVVRVRLRRITARGRTVDTDTPVLVLGGPGWATLTAGLRLVLVARLTPAEPGDNVAAVVWSASPPRAVSPGGLIWRVADRLREGLREACRGLPADSGGLLPSLVVGDTGRLPDTLRDDLRSAGLTHLTAVSGTNVTIVVGAVLWAVSSLGVARPLRAVVAGLAVAAFVVVARPEPSVLRAAVMGGAALLGLATFRRSRGAPVLCATVLGLLTVDPWLSRSPGFALSCVATGALLLLAPPWTRRLSRWLPVPLAAAIAVPAAAQAACGPVLVLLDPALSLSAVPANLLTEPVVAPATVAGALAALLAPVSLPLAHVCAWAGSLATGWIATVARVGASLPGNAVPWFQGPGGAVLLTILTTGLVTVTLLPSPRSLPPGSAEPGSACPFSSGGVATGHPRGVRRPPPGLVLRTATAMLLVAGAGWLLALRLPFPRAPRAWPPTGWAVAQCDVGQGAATVLRSGPHQAVLVDAGPGPPAVDDCLRRLDVRRLDVLLLTHFHADHVGGLSGALNGRGAGRLVVGPSTEPASEAATVRRVASDAGIAVERGRPGTEEVVGSSGWTLRWQVHLLGASGTSLPQGDEAVNEASLAWTAQVTGPAGTLKVTGLGDVGATGQERLVRLLHGGPDQGRTPSDVLVVAHHGSASQDPRLCQVLAPRIAVIGVGKDNDYGHPSDRTLAMLRDCGPVVHRTDRSGSVALLPTGDGGLAVAVRRA
ncbi:MAG: competence protein ComEC [Actinomycetota bacterium]|nr:competence protein ComEC [Actinomycetota bacterium]